MPDNETLEAMAQNIMVGIEASGDHDWRAEIILAALVAIRSRCAVACEAKKREDGPVYSDACNDCAAAVRRVGEGE